MDVSAVALQQASTQTNTALSMLKNAANAEQQLANVLMQSTASGGRGQNLDITV